MFSFLISLCLLVAGYALYGRFVEKVFGPTDAPTPAVTHADGIDFIRLPGWKVFMIQFLNIAGTGPIFGAIMGARFGPAAYMWIVLGCIFGGAVHDYLCGMLSVRNGGAGVPDIIGKYLGGGSRKAMLVFTVFLLILVGAVFVYSPAVLLAGFGGSTTLWVLVIFAYYLVATFLPVDKLIGRIYPVFAFSLIFMALALMAVLVVQWPSLPEVWDGLATRIPDKADGSLFPFLFVTIACGAISGFHATQSPLMARCIGSERAGRPVFYGAMITEGIVALVWATVASWFFWSEPQPGFVAVGAEGTGLATSAPVVVNTVCQYWLGALGGVLALLGVVAAPITSGDTALRSARLIIADFLHLPQGPARNRLWVCLPIFLATMGVLLWQIESPEGFNTLWQYFGWANQTIVVFTLWAFTVFLRLAHKPYWITLVPALLMTAVCTSFVIVSPSMLGLPAWVGVGAALLADVAAVGAFMQLKV